MRFTIGSDPELFLSSTLTGEVSSVIGLLGGTKEDPKDIGYGCTVQEDNILAEFNIPPVKSVSDFLKSINYCKDYISTIAAASGLRPYYSSSEIVSDAILDSEAARKFGCSPSYNVITEDISEIDLENVSSDFLNLRTSGFHIHFGWDEPTDEDRKRLVLCFELMASMPLSFYDFDLHHRRRFYGLFGDCRFTDYGVECRSLGGYFLKDDQHITRVWNGALNAIDLFEKKIPLKTLREAAEYCIGDNDIILRENLVEATRELVLTETKETTT